MGAGIVTVSTEILPALRFIGKRCLCGPEDFPAKWDEWFADGWFERLEKLGPAPENGGAYLGATHGDEYWIGMLFPPETLAPEGFGYIESPEAKYGVFQFAGKNDRELLGEEGIGMVFEEMGKRGWTPGEGLCIERYSRPPGPDGRGKVLRECLLAIQ